MTEDIRIIYDPFLREKCEFSNYANYYGHDVAERMWEKQERIRANPPPKRPKNESGVTIDIGKDIGGFIRSKAGRPLPQKQESIKKKEFTDEDRRKLREEVDRELEDVWSRKSTEELVAEAIKSEKEIPLFDFGLGEMSNQYDIKQFYGRDLFKRIDREIDESYECPSDGRETGQITQELWKLLRDIRASRKSIPEAKPEKKISKSRPDESEKTSPTIATVKPKPKIQKTIQVEQRQRQSGDDYKHFTERGLIRNESYVELFKGPGIVYEKIWANLVRKGWHDTDDYPIRKLYHDDQKLLVYCTSWRHLARQCKMSVNTVINIVKKFEDAGIVKTESFTPAGKKQEQTVFILGYWTGSGKSYDEHFYRDEKLLTPKASK